MADNPEITVPVTLDTKETESQAASLAKKIGPALAAGIASAVGVGSIALAFKKSIESAIESEEATNALNRAMALTGTFTEAASQKFQEFSTALQRTTGISDELINKNAALLVSVGNLSGQGLQDATKAALDLSTGLQIDVSTAFDVVTKATQGNVMMLQKYGLEVNKSASDSEKFAAALGFINSRFGDLASSNVNTLGGILQKISNAIGDLFENLGMLASKSKVFRAALLVIAEGIENFADKVGAVKDIDSSMLNLLSTFVKVGSGFINYIVKPTELFFNFFRAGLVTIEAMFLDVFYSIAGIMDTVFKTNLQPSIRSMLEIAAESLSEFTNTAAALDVSFSESMLNGLTAFQKAVVEKTKIISDAVNNSGKKTIAALKDTEAKMIDFSGSIANSIGSAMGYFANALKQGSFSFEHFANFLLSMAGDLAIQLGTMIVAAGLAASQVFAFNPAGMIGYGLALIGIGSVLKAFFGGGADTSAAGAQSPAQAPPQITQSTQESNSFATDQERIRPNAGVTVNVMGNVLDRRATGLEIVEAINEAFDMDGVTVRAISGVV